MVDMCFVRGVNERGLYCSMGYVGYTATIPHSPIPTHLHSVGRDTPSLIFLSTPPPFPLLFTPNPQLLSPSLPFSLTSHQFIPLISLLFALSSPSPLQPKHLRSQFVFSSLFSLFIPPT
jgi:hypothetical protein